MAEKRTKAQLVEDLVKSEDQARQLADEAQLLSSTLQVAATLESLEEALQRCIDIVCKYIGWPVGHLYIPDPKGDGELQPTSIWHLDDPRAFEQFRIVTEQTRFPPGVGLPGRILSSGEPEWIADVQNDDNFPRNKAGGDIKVRGGFGFPINIGSETVAVLEFFTLEPMQPDQRILDLMRLVGYQIGQVLERERSRETLVQQAEAFFNMSSILAEPDSYEHKLQLVMGELARVAEADWATLRVPDPQENILRLVARGGALSLATSGSEYSALSNSAIESGQPVVVNDYPAHPDALSAVISEGAKSFVSLPIKGTGETVAVAAVISKELDHFNPERVRLLTAIADGLGPLLENARLDAQVNEELERRRVTEAQLLQRSEELEALSKISSILAEPGAYEDKLPGAMQELARVAEAAWVTLRTTDPHESGPGSYLISITPDGSDPPSLPARQQGPSGVSVAAMETGETVVVNDYESYPSASPLHISEGINSSMACPVKTSEGTIGVVSIVSKEFDHFNSERVQLLTTIADGLGVFLEKAKLDGQIREELERRRVTEAQLLQRSEELEALSKMSSILAEPGAYEDKLPGAMQELARVAEAAWVTLRIPDPKVSGKWSYLISITPEGNESHIPQAQLRGPSATTVEAMKTGEPVVINDYNAYPDATAANIANGVNSVMGYPIKTTEGTVGVVSFVSKEFDHFNSERVQLLTTIADGLSVFLEKARLDGQIGEELERRRVTEAQLLQRSEELEALFSISSILAEPNSYEDKLKFVVQVLARVAESDRATVLVPDQREGGLRTIVRVSKDGGSLPELRSVRGLSIKAFESGQPVVSNDYNSLSDPDSTAMAEGTKSAISLPIKGANETIAVTSIISVEADHFNPERVRLLTAIVEGLGPLLENDKLDEQIREELERRRLTEAQLLQRSEELEALFKISSILAEPGAYEDKLPNAMRELARVAEAAWVTLRIVDPQESGPGSYLISITPEGRDSHSLPARQQGPSASAVEALATGEPVVVNDYQSYPDALPLNIADGINSAMSCPIKTTEGIIGVVSVVSKVSEHFNPERVQLLTAIADGLGVFLEKARLDGQIGEELARRRQTEAQLLQRSAELEALFTISSILGQPGDYESKLHKVMQELARVAEADWTTVLVPDPQEGGLRTIVRVRKDGSTLPVYHSVQGMALAVFEKGQAELNNDYQSHPNPDPSAIANGAKSAISFPIKGAEETLAVASVISMELDHFNPDRVRLLTAIVEGLGPLLENAKLDEQIREELDRRRQTEAQLLQRSEELEALFKISSILAEPGAYEDKLHSVLAELLLTAEGHWVNLLVPDPQERGMTVIAHARSDGRSIPVVSYSKGLALDVLDSGELLVENDYTSNPNADSIAMSEGANSMLGLPITATEETSAVVAIMSDELGHFNPERVRLLTAIVDGLGPLLENARLNQEITFKEEALRQSQKLESVGQLAAGVAHEVNNPLASILGFSKLLLGQDISESVKNDVQIIFDEADRAATIVQDLLSFARKGTTEKKRVGISEALERVLNLKAADFRANHVKVNLEIEEDLPDVEADEQRLQQVYLNLLTNAQHAMSAANDGGNIEIRCKRVGDVLRISFVDDGPGMTKDIIEKIFDPFFTTKAAGEGTGLGLSVCYGIIEDHGGRLWAESEPGVGATFYIELPCLVEAETPSTMAGH